MRATTASALKHHHGHRHRHGHGHQHSNRTRGTLSSPSMSAPLSLFSRHLSLSAVSAAAHSDDATSASAAAKAAGAALSFSSASGGAIGCTLGIGSAIAVGSTTWAPSLMFTVSQSSWRRIACDASDPHTTRSRARISHFTHSAGRHIALPGERAGRGSALHRISLTALSPSHCICIPPLKHIVW